MDDTLDEVNIPFLIKCLFQHPQVDSCPSKGKSLCEDKQGQTSGKKLGLVEAAFREQELACET